MYSTVLPEFNPMVSPGSMRAAAFLATSLFFFVVFAALDLHVDLRHRWSGNLVFQDGAAVDDIDVPFLRQGL